MTSTLAANTTTLAAPFSGFRVLHSDSTGSISGSKFMDLVAIVSVSRHLSPIFVGTITSYGVFGMWVVSLVSGFSTYFSDTGEHFYRRAVNFSLPHAILVVVGSQW